MHADVCMRCLPLLCCCLHCSWCKRVSLGGELPLICSVLARRPNLSRTGALLLLESQHASLTL